MGEEEEQLSIDIDSWGLRINNLFEEIAIEEKPTTKDLADTIEQMLDILSEQSAKIIELCNTVKVLDKTIVDLTGVGALVEGLKKEAENKQDDKGMMSHYA